MVFSETGAYLALIGRHGICAVEMPQKRGKFTQFEHGKETVNCRFFEVQFFVQDIMIPSCKDDARNSLTEGLKSLLGGGG